MVVGLYLNDTLVGDILHYSIPKIGLLAATIGPNCTKKVDHHIYHHPGSAAIIFGLNHLHNSSIEVMATIKIEVS